PPASLPGACVAAKPSSRPPGCGAKSRQVSCDAVPGIVSNGACVSGRREVYLSQSNSSYSPIEDRRLSNDQAHDPALRPQGERSGGAAEGPVPPASGRIRHIGRAKGKQACFHLEALLWRCPARPLAPRRPQFFCTLVHEEGGRRR